MDLDRKFMVEALKLARRGRGYAAPNPMVGCVIAHGTDVVGYGYHARFGAPHAEAEALEKAGPRARGATAYITLEPCCNQYEGKKTPPCVPALLNAGVERVVVACEDPHPEVQGKGVRTLREAGVRVDVGIMREEARAMNAGYFSLIERGRPYVTAKWAMTLDGKIATRKGDSKWISSEDSRALVHRERGASDVVMAGIGTVLADDPLLTARGDIKRQPLRVVLDPRMALPAKSRLVKSIADGPLLVYTSKYSTKDNRARIRDLGVEVKVVSADSTEHLSWSEIVFDLGDRKMASILLEGGGGLMASAFESKVIDRVMVFVAPLIIGGVKAITPVGGAGVPNISSGVRLDNMRTRVIGGDVLMIANAAYPRAGSEPSLSGIWRGYHELRPPEGPGPDDSSL